MFFYLYRKKREIPLEELPKEQDIYENSLEEWLDIKRALSSLPKDFYFSIALVELKL